MRRLCIFGIMYLLCGSAVASVRIKDITSVKGAREYQLLGYGIVIGLQGTGDTLRNSPFTEQAAMSMLDRVGVNIARIQCVLVICRSHCDCFIAPFGGWGSTLDVTVSSLGDATSLMGGTLVITSLTGVDGAVYAIAQGPIAVSGYSATGQNETLTHGVATVGRIPNGATIEREPPEATGEPGIIVLELRNPDFATSVQVTDAINRFTRRQYEFSLAHERDQRRSGVIRPCPGVADKITGRNRGIARAAYAPARVVIDERTGTVVIGQDVQISPVAVTHADSLYE